MDYIQKMRDLADKLRYKHQFKAGDVVRWKEGMRNRVVPQYDEKCVVFEALDAPVYDGETDSGSYSFREPLDISICRLDSDGNFVIYHFDSRRFELAE